MDLTDLATQRTRLRLGILGPLSASLDGVEVGLGGRRQQAVVAVLLVARGQQVSAERLLDTLWDGTPPPSGAASLQSYVSHVRKALEPDRAPRTPSQVLVSRGSGYALDVADDDVDAWRFEDLVTRAAESSDPAHRGGLLREALALWRGPVLAEYAGQAWADTEARRLGELRDVARERLLAARLDTGEAAVVVPEAEPRNRCVRSAGGSWRSRSTARTGRPTRSTPCAGPGHCSPTSSGSTRGRRCVRSRQRCSPSPRRSTPPLLPPRRCRHRGRCGCAPSADRRPGPCWSTARPSSVSCAPASGSPWRASPVSPSSRGQPGSARPASCTRCETTPGPPGRRC